MHSAIGASVDADTADLLIGREKLVDVVADYVQNGASVLVVGAAGMGKTAILQAVAHRAFHQGTSRRAIYCGEAATLRRALQLLAEGLYDRQRSLPMVTTGPRVLSRCQLARLPIGTLRQFVFPRLRAWRCVPLLDHLARVRGEYATFLDQLVEDHGVPLVAAARSLSPDETGRLWWVGLRFTLIEVAPLSRSDTRRLIDHCLNRFQIHLPDRQDFADSVIQRACGNPRIIVRLCRMAGESQYRISGKTDLRLLWLDLKISDLRLSPAVD